MCVHCSERQPPRSVRGLPESRLSGWGLPPARACPRPQRPLSTALTPTPRRPRVLRELDTHAEQLWPSRASPDCMPKPPPRNCAPTPPPRPLSRAPGCGGALWESCTFVQRPPSGDRSHRGRTSGNQAGVCGSQSFLNSTPGMATQNLKTI